MSYDDFINEKVGSVKELKTDFCHLRFEKVKTSLWYVDLYLKVYDCEVRYIHIADVLTPFCAYSLFYDYSKKYEKKCKDISNLNICLPYRRYAGVLTYSDSVY